VSRLDDDDVQLFSRLIQLMSLMSLRRAINTAAGLLNKNAHMFLSIPEQINLNVYGKTSTFLNR
jgi:hypothetical protein